MGKFSASLRPTSCTASLPPRPTTTSWRKLGEHYTLWNPCLMAQLPPPAHPARRQPPRQIATKPHKKASNTFSTPKARRYALAILTATTFRHAHGPARVASHRHPAQYCRARQSTRSHNSQTPTLTGCTGDTVTCRKCL